MAEPTERPILFSGPMVNAILEDRKTQTRRIMKENTDGCPYGIPGDRLWVRESWAPLSNFDPAELGYLYRADYHKGLEKKDGDQKWKPSIHMPRAASRITLEITGLKVERLQDISSADCIAEGIESDVFDQTIGFRNYLEKNDFFVHWADGKDFDDAAKESYQSLWNTINGPDSWAQNPWVWAIQFKRIST